MTMNRPIDSPIKSKRIGMGELIYHNCWAFMRELRTHNCTKRIYEVDPYAEVYQFRENLYGIFTENLDGMGDAWSYLILGPEKALLIDTGFGLGDLKGLVDLLCGGRELVVAVTHAHPDHASGNFQFDRVYALEEEIPMLQANMERPLLNDRIVGPDGKCLMVEFDPHDMIRQTPYEIAPMRDGHVFHLGEGYDVEVLQLAGHTRGQAAFLDKKGRTLFPGDDIIGMRVSVGGAPGSLRDFRDRMARLALRSGEFDGIFPGHFIVDIDSAAVADMVTALDAILSDPENYDYVEERARGLTYCKAVKGLGCIGYSMEAL